MQAISVKKALSLIPADVELVGIGKYIGIAERARENTVDLLSFQILTPRISRSSSANRGRFSFPKLSNRPASSIAFRSRPGSSRSTLS